MKNMRSLIYTQFTGHVSWILILLPTVDEFINWSLCRYSEFPSQKYLNFDVSRKHSIFSRLKLDIYDKKILCYNEHN